MDGTEKLCQAVYGRPATASDYVGGAAASFLHDAAAEIERLRAELERVRTIPDRLLTWSQREPYAMSEFSAKYAAELAQRIIDGEGA